MGGAVEMKELPFVVGVLADLSGKPTEPLPKLGDRKFVEIDRENFDKVLKGMKPRLEFDVENALTNDNSKMRVELNFESMTDFQPDQVVNQVKPLKKLLDIRNELAGLLAKTQGNDTLSDRLKAIMENTEDLQRISKEAASGGDSESKGGQQ
jgi:type VI secretion system protein ImpB